MLGVAHSRPAARHRHRNTQLLAFFDQRHIATSLGQELRKLESDKRTTDHDNVLTHGQELAGHSSDRRGALGDTGQLAQLGHRPQERRYL